MGERLPTNPVALKEHILETLYSQKERARIFSRFLTDLWKRINELSAEQIARLELQIGKERMSLLRQDKNPAEAAKREESLALLDSFAPEMKREIFSGMSSDPRQQEFFKRKRTETKAFMDIVNKPQLVEYLKQLGFDVNLKVVPGTIKGNVIIAKKKSV